MKLTKRGETLISILFVIGMIGVMAIVGAVETQDWPGCEEYRQSQDWESAWEKGCPFQDENGNYLYTWEPN